MSIIEELLDFESDGAVLGFRFRVDDLMIWPFVRWGILLEAVMKELGRRLTERRLGPGPAVVARYLWQSMREDPLREARTYDILILGSTTGVVVRKEGKWFGRINDHFAMQAPDQTLVIDQAHAMEYRYPRYVPHAARHDGIKIRAELKRRLFDRSPKTEDQRSIDGFIDFLRKRFPRPLPMPSCAPLAASLRRIAGRLRYLQEDYRRLFDRLCPRVVFLEDASYGTENYIIKWAKDAGIRTGEFQHGTIVPSHHAYNYGRTPRDNADYRRTLPDYLLTYGSFWSENTRTASEKIVIGNPHLSTRLASRKSSASPEATLLVVLSQPESALDLVSLALEGEVRLGRDGYRFVYRLHPLESAADAVYGPLRARPSIALNTGGDVYDLLEGASAVIGVSSTALFEAAALGKPVLVYDNPVSRFYMPRGFGTWFCNVEELDELLRGTLRAEAPERYWAKDWERNYRSFLEEKVYA
jgi:hypothetical protein